LCITCGRRGKNQPGVSVFIQGKVFYRGADLWIIANSLYNKELTNLFIGIITIKSWLNRFFLNVPAGLKLITCG
jgi:hypothetical protein